MSDIGVYIEQGPADAALPIDNLTRMPILAFYDVKIDQPS